MTALGVAMVVGAYLLGAIPFGLLIGLRQGVDIRRAGSGNIGATNVGRVLGRRWGHVCLLLDILKGFVPTLAAGMLLVPDPPDAAGLTWWLAVGVAAVIGHTFPVYLGFRGGKGVATTVGVALGIFPHYAIPMLASLLAYAALRYITGVVSAGSLILAICFPVAFAVYVLAAPRVEMRTFWPLQAAAVALALLIVARHASNISRMLRGSELRAAEPPPRSAGGDA